MTQATGQRDLVDRGPTAVLGQGLPAHLDGLHGLGQALELELAQRTEGVRAPAAGHDLDELGGQDLAALGPGAQAGRLDDRVAEVVVALPASPRRR